MAHYHSAESAYASHALPFEVMLLAMLLEEHKLVSRLQKQIERSENRTVKTLDGWIFDVYPAGRDMVVWVIDADGHAHCLRDTFTPAFFVGGNPRDLVAVAVLADQSRLERECIARSTHRTFLGTRVECAASRGHESQSILDALRAADARQTQTQLLQRRYFAAAVVFF